MFFGKCTMEDIYINFYYFLVKILGQQGDDVCYSNNSVG